MSLKQQTEREERILFLGLINIFFNLLKFFYFAFWIFIFYFRHFYPIITNLERNRKEIRTKFEYLPNVIKMKPK